MHSSTPTWRETLAVISGPRTVKQRLPPQLIEPRFEAALRMACVSAQTTLHGCPREQHLVHTWGRVDLPRGGLFTSSCQLSWRTLC
jgi:hypothetical protein